MMNLQDLNELIKTCQADGDVELRKYYEKKRRELIAILNRDIVRHISEGGKNVKN